VRVAHGMGLSVSLSGSADSATPRNVGAVTSLTAIIRKVALSGFVWVEAQATAKEEIAVLWAGSVFEPQRTAPLVLCMGRIRPS